MRRYENFIQVLVVTGISAFLMGIVFDFYFDLNDDIMMRDIMSGIYSGTPDGHNMQTLYPLGAFLALCYRICRPVPWYGLFLFLCQFGCFYLIGLRLLNYFRREGERLFALAALFLFQWGTWLTHMVNAQYTITCAMLSAAAVFWFLTTPPGLSVKKFIQKNIPAVILLILAFQLRSEMMLLTLPFFVFAVWICWWEERPVLTMEKIKKYGVAAGLILLGMMLSFLIDLAAYSGEQWRDFRQFFNARTTVYDFYPEVVTQDAYGDALRELEVSPAQQTLLRNYNFGLDEEIDTEMLEEVAAYAADSVGGERDWGAILKDKLFLYYYRTLHSDDAPYNLLVIFGYAVNIIAIVILYRETREDYTDGLGKRRLCWRLTQLVLLALMRSGLWMFILMRGRDPERITHSLYLVEFVLLVAMLLRLPKVEWRVPSYIMAALFVLLTTVSLMGSLTAVNADQSRREEHLRDWEAIDSYCAGHSDNFYFEDVYSTVAFSGKLFDSGRGICANYDIAGGWMCKSPLYREKLGRYGIESAGDALAGDGRVYFIMSDAEESERGLDWLKAFYEERGREAEIWESDKIGENYRVYQVGRGR
ncbi:MAG: hypothetical protein K2N43_07195 [Lachnospiraceae bacterium]|nr:hypothetical protein [Lachnospiraceae bacterium]